MILIFRRGSWTAESDDKGQAESWRQKREHDSFLNKPLETFLLIRLIRWVMRIEQSRHTGTELWLTFSLSVPYAKGCLRVSQRYQLHSWDMNRWHLLLSLGTQDKDKAKASLQVSFQSCFWGKGSWWEMTAGKAGGRMGKGDIPEGKHKVLERRIQPHSVLAPTAQGWKCFASLALNLLWIYAGMCWGAEVRLSSVVPLSLEPKEGATVGPPPSSPPGCCCLPWGCSPPTQCDASPVADTDRSGWWLLFSWDTLSLENAKAFWAAPTAITLSLIHSLADFSVPLCEGPRETTPRCI